MLKKAEVSQLLSTVQTISESVKEEEGLPLLPPMMGFSKDEIKIIKREEDLKKTFHLGSEEMQCFSNFEQAEGFLSSIINKKNFILLASSFKKVQQIFILKKDINSRPKVVEVHLIN